MKCPIDQTEMEKGGLMTDGNRWVLGGSGMFKPLFGKADKDTVYAYKCPKCGKVELSTN